MEEKEEDKISEDSFTGSPGSPDLLTTVLAECDGTGTLDMRDQRSRPRVVHDGGCKEEEYRDLAHSCMSDFNFCDEIFNELEKPQHSQNSLIAKLLEESAKLLKIFLVKMSQGSVEL